MKIPEPPFSLKDLLQPVPAGATVSTNTPDEVRAMRDRAAQDLTDIRALGQTPAFERFFLRRVRQKRDQAINALITSECDALTREGHRIRVLALEEVLTLLEDDDQAARRLMG